MLHTHTIGVTRENVMTQKTAIKYLTLNAISLISFVWIKNLYLTNSIQAEILYSTPSLLGGICLTSLPIPLLYYFKNKRMLLFKCYLSLASSSLVFDEYNTLFSNNHFFDYIDLCAIITGTIITFLLFKPNI